MNDNPFEVENLEPHKSRRWLLPVILASVVICVSVLLFAAGVVAYLILRTQ